MGLDMSIYKYNKRMDEETFEKALRVRDINVERAKAFIEEATEVYKLADGDFGSDVLKPFYEKYLSDFMVSKIYPTIQSEEEYNSKKHKSSYEKYVTETMKMADDFKAKAFSDLFEQIMVANKDIELYKECEDILSDLGDSEEIAYWRKHSDLNGYMENLYYENGGDKEFNCVPLYLTKEDIEMIIEEHERHLDKDDDFEIPESRGFFWGETTEEDWVESLEDFKKILKETDWENSTVFYSCWW